MKCKELLLQFIFLASFWFLHQYSTDLKFLTRIVLAWKSLCNIHLVILLLRHYIFFLSCVPCSIPCTFLLVKARKRQKTETKTRIHLTFIFLSFNYLNKLFPTRQCILIEIKAVQIQSDLTLNTFISKWHSERTNLF